MRRPKPIDEEVMTNRIARLFDNLDRWRHLPSYQLERRADAFFALYLPEVIQARFGAEVEALIPEFPVRIGTIQPESESNQSFRIDYFVKLKETDVVLLVELKTDPGSRRGTQDRYLHDAAAVGVNALLDGVLAIYAATNAKGKYRYLLEELQRLGMVTRSDRRRYAVNPAECEVKIVYIQPHSGVADEEVISFAEVANIVDVNDDEISQRFAASLRLWSHSVRASQALAASHCL